MAETGEKREAVLAANEAFYRAFNLRDVVAMEALWATSREVACIHPGWNVLAGRDDVLESWRRILANPRQARIVTGGAEAIFLGEAAIVICRELVGPAQLVATNVFCCEEGEWKLVHHQSGPVQAG